MLGNLLWYVLPKFGGTRQEQLSALWLRMKIYFADCAIQDTIGNLTFGMLRKKSTTSPKLRTRAAETRALIPFGESIAQSMLDSDIPFELGIKDAMHFLQLSYDCLHKDRFDQVHFQNVVFKFLQTYQCLGSLATEEYTWHLKPKFHLLAEIALAGDCPSLNWCYRDEEAGGSISKIGRSRGGQQTLWSVSSRCLQKFCCDFQAPVFDEKDFGSHALPARFCACVSDWQLQNISNTGGGTAGANVAWIGWLTGTAWREEGRSPSSRTQFFTKTNKGLFFPDP